MCRFLVYKGSDEILLSKLILDPTHSMLKQSFDARLRLDTRRGQNNADGFGIGFYTDPKLGPAPCMFRSIIPAWNCSNLERIASKTASRLIFAHVRAATDGTLSEEYCHPFAYGSLMWMHNGSLGGWKQIKRRLTERLEDKWYHVVCGGTDSEWAFALFLNTLKSLGCDPSNPPDGGFGPAKLREAMLSTIAIINEIIDQIPESTILAENVDTRSLLNFALSDGHSVICTRYINSTTDQAASLYYSSGSQWEKRPSPGDDKDYHMERRDKGADIVLVASEPLTFERENWVDVPTNSILTIHGQTVMVHPIRDQYYNRGPAQRRSAAFVQTKGLVANEKPSLATRLSGSFPGASLSEIMMDAPSAKKVINLRTHHNQNFNHHQYQHHPTIPTSLVRSGTPDRAQSFFGRPQVASAGVDVASHTSPSGLKQLQLQQSASSPSQGNIKKKRILLNGLEHHHDDAADPDTDPDTAISLADPPRNNYGDPNKIAQFFPELRSF